MFFISLVGSRVVNGCIGVGIIVGLVISYFIRNIFRGSLTLLPLRNYILLDLITIFQRGTIS